MTAIAIHFQRSIDDSWLVTVTRFNGHHIGISKTHHEITGASYQRLASLVRKRVRQKIGYVLPWTLWPGSWSYYDHAVSPFAVDDLVLLPEEVE